MTTWTWTAWAVDEHGNGRPFSVWGETEQGAIRMARQNLMSSEELVGIYSPKKLELPPDPLGRRPTARRIS